MNMRSFRYTVILALFLFILGLGHLWSRVEIGKLSYNIYNKKERLQDLFDRRLNILYNLYRVCNYKDIERVENYNFAEKNSFITIKIVKKRPPRNKSFSVVERIFGLNRTAQAEE